MEKSTVCHHLVLPSPLPCPALSTCQFLFKKISSNVRHPSHKHGGYAKPRTSRTSHLDEGKSPTRAKKSSRRKRPHHHDDDDLLLSEATALADHERTLMREEMRTRLAAQLCPLSHLMFLSNRPGQCQLCDQSAEELAWCPRCEEGACCRLSRTSDRFDQPQRLFSSSLNARILQPRRLSSPKSPPR